eukprot:SAG31_NODE_3667_length_4007_cov_1.970317_1_plen_96_part_00
MLHPGVNLNIDFLFHIGPGMVGTCMYSQYLLMHWHATARLHINMRLQALHCQLARLLNLGQYGHTINKFKFSTASRPLIKVGPPPLEYNIGRFFT